MPDAECEPVVAVADCRVRAATDLLTHTWDPVVLIALRGGGLRRRDLRAAVGPISDKVLTEALTRLERRGLVARERRPQAPPRVDYALTPLGRSLAEGPLVALGLWAAAHGDALVAAGA